MALSHSLSPEKQVSGIAQSQGLALALSIAQQNEPDIFEVIVVCDTTLQMHVYIYDASIEPRTTYKFVSQVC